MAAFAQAPTAEKFRAEVARLEDKVASRANYADLLRLSELLDPEDARRAWDFATRARALADNPGDQLRADLWRAYLQWRQGKQNEALAAAREGITRARELRRDDLLARALYVVAIAQDRLADFPGALETYRELVPLADRLNDLAFRAEVQDALAVTFLKTGDFTRALAAIDQAMDAARRADAARLIPTILAHRGNILRSQGDPEAGQRLIEQSVELRLAQGGDSRGIADQHINLGAIAEDRQDWPTALRHFSRAVELHSRLGFALNHANAEQCLAGVLTRLGRTDEALAHLTTALRLAEPTGSQTILARVYRELARVHETRGDFRSALEFARKQAAAEDAALGEKARFRVAELTARYDLERRQAEVRQLNEEQRRRDAERDRDRWQRYSLVAGSVLLTVFAAALIWRLRREHDLRLENERARAAAEEADRLKTYLLGLASHDLKSPLFSIQRGAELLARSPGVGPAEARHADAIGASAHQMQNLVRDLLDIAALESGRLELHRTAVEISALVAEAVAAHRPHAERKRQPLTLTLPDGPSPLVFADAARLRQAIDNLVDNALKFTPEGKAIRVTVAVRPGECDICVADDGPGLTPEDMARLYQPFRPLSSRATGGESSSGLGLHLTREFVALHEGRIVAESPPGSGAVFTISLPTVPPR